MYVDFLKLLGSMKVYTDALRTHHMEPKARPREQQIFVLSGEVYGFTARTLYNLLSTSTRFLYLGD